MKVFIESVDRGVAKCYRLLTDSAQVSPACLTNSFNNYIRLFHLNVDPNYSTNCILTPEVEMAKVFCDVVNYEFGRDFLSVGNRNECYCSFNQAIYTLRKQLEDLVMREIPSISSILSDEKILFSIISKGSEILNPLDEIDRKKSKEIEEKIRSRKQEIYAQIIKILLKEDIIDPNQPIPLLFNTKIEDMGIYYSYYGDNYVDAFPLNLAYNIRDVEYIQFIVDQGAYKFVGHPSCTRNKLTDVFVFILKNSRTDKHISLIYDLFERDKEVSTDLSMAGGREVLLEAYKACLRINSIESIKRLLSFQRYNLMKCLQGRDVFSPQTTHIPEQFNLSPEVHKFIELNIASDLRNYRDYDPKEHGIWGYNAVTGDPIYEWQMRDIDSQKW